MTSLVGRPLTLLLVVETDVEEVIKSEVIISEVLLEDSSEVVETSLDVLLVAVTEVPAGTGVIATTVAPGGRVAKAAKMVDAETANSAVLAVLIENDSLAQAKPLVRENVVSMSVPAPATNCS